MRSAPSSRMVSPFSMRFSQMCFTSAAYSAGFPSRCGNGTLLASDSCASGVKPAIIGVSKMPGAIVTTRIPERGFDFSQDYEVINLLARSLYNRARIESLDSPARNEFLARSVGAFRRTLAVDSENVDAHYGLGLAYTELARAEPESEPGSRHLVGPGSAHYRLVANSLRPASTSRPSRARLPEPARRSQSRSPSKQGERVAWAKSPRRLPAAFAATSEQRAGWAIVGHPSPAGASEP